MAQKILMVCLGNICRSPLAEGILSSKLNHEFIVDSAGTGDWHAGEKPDKRSIEVAKKHGIDISYQRARQIKKSDLEEFDLIFAMDESNYLNLLAMTTDEHQKEKIKMILGDSNVPDPYYGGLSDFEHVFELLDKVTDDIVKELNQ